MAGVLSPLQLQAGASILQNNGLQVAPTVTNSVGSYESTTLIAPFVATFANVVPAGLTDSTIADLQLLASTSCPALADSIPTAFVTSGAGPVITTFPIANVSNTTPGMSGIISTTANTYLGNGDLGKFAQLFSTAQGYVQSTNLFINSAVNAENYLTDTFTNMDDLVTGDLTQVNLDTLGFGEDLERLGYAINLGNLKGLGYPLTLIKQIANRGGVVTPLVIALTLTGISEDVVIQLTNPELAVDDGTQKAMYQALTLITGDDLTQIKNILNVTTENLNTAADLLNPVKMFPNSFSTLTAPTCAGLRAIYLETDGTVNSKLETQLPALVIENYQRLRRIIPEDQALANQGLSASLQQITNISNLYLPELAAGYLGVETNQGLPDINSETSVLPQSDINFYKNTYATGTGPNGTILLVDVLGTLVGTVSANALSNVTSIIGDLSTAGALTTLTGLYTDMQNTVDGVYGNPVTGPVTIPAGPAAGVYADADTAFSTALIPSAQTSITTIIGAYPTQTANLNVQFTAIGNQLALEASQQNKATILIEQLIGNSQTSLQSLVLALPSYGKDTEAGMAAQILETIADTATAGGQAVVGSLREGRTGQSLDAAGVASANKVNGDPPNVPPQADLSPTRYTSAQAQAKLIT